MAMAVGPGRGIKNEINVTPLVDVVLVLLIIFMVVTPMLQRGKDVRLPKAQQIEKEHPGKKDPIIVSVTRDKKTFVEKDEFEDEKFQEKIRQELDAAPGRTILLKGDESLTYGDVRKVMNLARKGGAKGISLGVEELKAK
ncbi:MAG TPA: biopolymer transporter ExbD [Myxococcaceae bacterium]|nr:biopolymer transporter ExbD [Myxococcaceae bacterium]